MAENKSMCIIGNGGAGIEAIKALRQNKFAGDIHLISDSMWPAYNPMLTTYYVSGKIDFAAMFPYGYDMDFYNRYDVKLHLGSPAEKLDAAAKTVSTASGCTWQYDKCLIATGASVFLPPIEGIKNKKVFAMRTVEDALKMKEALKQSPKKALVVGASMVGIKIVELLYDAGVEICLADMAPRIFPLAADKDCSRIIEDRLISKGIKLRFGAGIQKITENSDGLHAHFSDGKDPEEADIIAVCIGVRPNLSFVDKNQIEIDKGIVVDEHMRSSNAHVYAAGDVAQGNNLLTGEKQIIGLWPNARYQGRTAGRNMAGLEDTYSGTIPHNITHFMHMVFSGFGDMRYQAKTETKTADGGFVKMVWNDSCLMGVNMLDCSCSDVGIAKNALEKSLRSEKPEELENLCCGNIRNSMLYSHFIK